MQDQENQRHHIEIIPAEQMNFIPEQELDEYGNLKKRKFKQKPYEAPTEYGG